MPEFQVLNAEAWMLDTPVYSSDKKLIGRLCWVTTSSEKDTDSEHKVQCVIVNSHGTYLKIPAEAIDTAAGFRVALNTNYADVQQFPECELPDNAGTADTLAGKEVSPYSKRPPTRPVHAPMHRRSQRNI